MKGKKENTEILDGFFMMFRYYGIYPKRGAAINDIKFHVQFMIIIFLYSNATVGGAMLLFQMFYRKEHILIKDLLDNLVVLAAGIGMHTVILVFRKTMPLMQKIIRKISHTGDRFGVPDDMWKRNKQMELFGYASFFYTFFGAISYTLVGILDIDSCKQQKIEYNLSKVCGMMQLTWMPFDIESFPNYQIFWVLQFVTCTAIASLTLVISVFLFSINEMFMTRIAHWRDKFNVTFNLKDEEEQRAHLNLCIEYHFEIIELYQQINLYLSPLILTLLLMGSPIISIISFTFMLKHELKSVFHVFGWITSTFLICYCGQRLIDESEKMTMEVYSCKWYNAKLTFQKDIYLMILRMQKLMVLNAYGFFDVSLAQFCSMMQNSYSFLALLNQTYKE
ncbi:PREDICTED: putative odorant receptor 85d [Nicrophorus vespilloides]|uniref:Odorant receptor n=1 Tax=Nicrophorus vespilloides TaxID=110193 RepID=A0ABM1MEV3_NICVS|nr:PREDICTED: putative odorant receptor 85d [Nicrophorus vespilloides]